MKSLNCLHLLMSLTSAMTRQVVLDDKKKKLEVVKIFNVKFIAFQTFESQKTKKWFGFEKVVKETGDIFWGLNVTLKV